MKKLSIIILILIATSLVGCTNTKKVKEKKFIEKCAFEEKDNTWIYYFCTSYGKDSKGEFTILKEYDFNAIDLVNKDKSDDFYIPILDNKTGELLGKQKVNTQMLLYGSKTKKDIENIYDYFSNKKFASEIAMSDLSELKLTNIRKEDIIKLFNNSLSASKREFGEYGTLPMINTLTTISPNGNLVLGYFIYYGNIEYVRIDFIDKETNKHLSELVEEKKATQEQIDDYNNLKNLEKEIVSKQKLDLPISFKGKYINTNDLKALLQEIK